MIRDQYRKGYKDTVYNDDSDSDIYGSALDELISEIRGSDDSMSKDKRFADARVLDEYNKLTAGAGLRSDSPGTSRERVLHIDSGGGDVAIGEGVLRSSGKNGNGNGNGKY